jgi:hypothetical protein
MDKLEILAISKTYASHSEHLFEHINLLHNDLKNIEVTHFIEIQKP